MMVQRERSKATRGATVPWKGRVVNGRLIWALDACCVLLLLLPRAASAQGVSLEVLHKFNPATEGAHPHAPLVQGADGSFYGTTERGGANGFGTIFKLDSAGVLTTLHSFQGSDCEGPVASLTPGEGGSFYGTTPNGGLGPAGGLGRGVIFRLTASPGGLRLPGDCDADGRRGISDAVCFLGFLFLGEPKRLPCGSGLLRDGANLQLLDHNGTRTIGLSDAVALLSFLFLGGSPPHSGLDCLAIPGCTGAERICPP